MFTLWRLDQDWGVEVVEVFVTLVRFGKIWWNLANFCEILQNFAKFGKIWRNLVKFEIFAIFKNLGGNLKLEVDLGAT